MNIDPERTRGRAAIAIGSALLLTTVAGIAVGARWHERLPSWLAAGDEPESVAARPDAPTQLWTCGMHPQVIQDEPGFCPICHMALTPLEVEGASGQSDTPSTPKGERKIKYWWDPMLNPPYISDKPGKSPMGMDLVPVYEDEAPSGTAITIDPAVVQNMGVKTAVVREGPLVRTVRAFGRVREAEPNVREVNLLVSGWIRRLHADTEGMHVRKYAPLFDLYSPELHAAVEDAIRLRRSAPGSELARAAVRRLELWGLSSGQAERLSKLGRAPKTVTFTSPIAGVVIDKAVVEGAAVEAGASVMRIVDHDVLWIDTEVFEQHLAAVSIGQKIVARVSALPGETFAGQVSFVHPHVDPKTRTAVVRVEIDNTARRLLPGMYATVELEVELARESLLVPREAVIDTGVRQVVFVAMGGGRFEAREVTMGASDGTGTVQVLAGLVVGEQVVTSGQFLLDSESRLREAVQKFLREREESPPPLERDEPPSPPEREPAKPKPEHDELHRAAGADAAPQPATDASEELYTCPMHPEVQQLGPGQCPICHMDLVPTQDGDR